MLNFRTVNITTIILLAGLCITGYFTPVPLWFFSVIVIGWLFMIIIGSFFIKYNYHVKSLLSNREVSGNRIAITFDDGPHPQFTPEILELLRQSGAKATFFCIGKHIEAHPDLFRKIIDGGHSVGNHTYSHSGYFGFFSSKKVARELEKTNRVVKELTGLNMRLYRPAYGVTNPHIRKALKVTGLHSVGWSKRSLDTTALDTETVLKRVTTGLKKGDIILLHDTSAKTVTVLERLLSFMQERNMQSVTVDSLFNIKAYA